jgi:hypothetical protein
MPPPGDEEENDPRSASTPFIYAIANPVNVDE